MNLFNLMATLGLDSSSYEDGLAKAESQGRSFGSRLGSTVGTGIKAVGAGLAAAGSAAVAVTTMATKSFAEYEQLVGGAQLLYGDAYEDVAARAKKAYSTVQMSQNAYLRQVNGFATGLKTALGGNAKAAAELADKVLTAEADVIAATGASQEAIQNAFNGIMKSNYMMLDNLQLGITPTKAGFQELIDTVNEWNEAQGRNTDYQIDNLADAQSALVDYVEMQGLSGYAAMEASQTITGSLAAVKASWEDLLVAVAGGGDLAETMTAVSTSIETAAGNLVPVITQALGSTGQLAGALASVFIGSLPQFIEEVIPGLIGAAVDIVQALADNLPAIASAIVSIIPALVDAIVEAIPIFLQAVLSVAGAVFDELLNGGALGEIVSSIIGFIGKIGQKFPAFAKKFAEKLPDLIRAVVDFIDQNLPLIVEGLVQFTAQIAEALPDILRAIGERLPEIIDMLMASLLQNLPIIIEGLIMMIDAIVDSLPEIMEALADSLPGIIESIISGVMELLPMILDCVLMIIESIVDNLPTIIQVLVDDLPHIIDMVIAGILDSLPSIIRGLVRLVFGIIEAIPRIIRSFLHKIPEIIKTIIAGFDEKIQDFLDLGRRLVEGIWEGIKGAGEWLWGKINEWGGTVVGWFKDVFGIHSPSAVFESEIGVNLGLGVGKGWEKSLKQVRGQISKDLLLEPGYSSTMSLSGAGRSSTTIGAITINVSGADVHDVDGLADLIAEKLNADILRREAVYA